MNDASPMLVCALAVVACAPAHPHIATSNVAQPEARSMQPGASASASTPASPAPPPQGSSARTPAADTPSASPSASAPPAATLSARGLLAKPGAALSIDYDASAPSRAAAAQCEKSHPNNAAAQTACTAKARDAFQPDLLMFPKDVLTFQDPDAGFSMVTYKQRGVAMTEVHRVRIRFGDETGASVTVKFMGGEHGSRAISRGAAEFVVTAVSDHRVEITDPDLGALEYDAEVGLLGGLSAQ